MRTEDHAQLIAESYINGQKYQARQQFRAAVKDGCSASYILTDMTMFASEEQIRHFAGSLLENPFS